MRVGRFFTRKLVFGVSSCLLIAGLSAGGCGGTSETTPPATDAGHDAVVVDATQPMADTGPDVFDSGVTACTVDADLTMINVPDGSLADGASSIGVCIGCAETTCKNEVAACNADCDCKSAMADFFACYAGSSSIFKCGAPILQLGTNARVLAAALVGCVDPGGPAGGSGPGCKDQCAIGALFPDGGKDAADDGDAASDAPNDG